MEGEDKMRYLGEQTSTTAHIQYPEPSQGATYLTPTMHSQQVITGSQRPARMNKISISSSSSFLWSVIIRLI